MKKRLYIYFLTIVIIGCLASCGVKKHVQQPSIDEPQSEQAQTWHTVVAKGTASIGIANQSTPGSNYTLQAIKDSVVVLSITPLLGIEIMRIEATPNNILVVNKANRTYTTIGYDELARWTTPAITFADLQDIANGNGLQEGNNSIHKELNTQLGTIIFQATYQQTAKDQPLNIQPQNLQRYTPVSSDKILSL